MRWRDQIDGGKLRLLRLPDLSFWLRPARAMLDRIRQRMSELVLSDDIERIERSVPSYRCVVRFDEPM